MRREPRAEADRAAPGLRASPWPGEEIAAPDVDQVLLTDTNGTMAWLQFEAMGFAAREGRRRVVTYIDHNVYQSTRATPTTTATCRPRRAATARGSPSPATASATRCTSRRSACPGQLVLGTDSHTPLCGATGMLAIGAGGLDVAVRHGRRAVLPAHAARRARRRSPAGCGPGSSAKDVILELLRRSPCAGGSGKIFEYAGPGAADALAAPARDDRNMGAELALTTSVFPSDEVTREYFALLGREARRGGRSPPIRTPSTTTRSRSISATLEPLVALPGSPDRVVPVGEVEGTPIEQVMVGSCTNGSWEDMSVGRRGRCAGEQVAPDGVLRRLPGQPRILEMMAREGLLADLLAAGAGDLRADLRRVRGHRPRARRGHAQPARLQPQLPGAERHEGRPGLLCSPLTAAVSALTGVITDPRDARRRARAALPGVASPRRWRA